MQVVIIVNLVAWQSVIGVYVPAVIASIKCLWYGTIGWSVIEGAIDKFRHCVQEVNGPAADPKHDESNKQY